MSGLESSPDSGARKGEEMKTLKRVSLGFAGMIVVAAALQLAAPRAVHSAVAALVSVVGNVAVTNPLNSSGSPQPLVVQDVASGAGKIVSVSTSCSFGTVLGSDCQGSGLAPAWPDQTVVVTDVSGNCVDNAYLLAVTMTYTVPSGGSLYASSFNLTPSLNAAAYGYFYYSFGRQTNLIIPAGHGGPNLLASSAGATAGSCSFTVSGYALNQ